MEDVLRKIQHKAFLQYSHPYNHEIRVVFMWAMTKPGEQSVT